MLRPPLYPNGLEWAASRVTYSDPRQVQQHLSTFVFSYASLSSSQGMNERVGERVGSSYISFFFLSPFHSWFSEAGGRREDVWRGNEYGETLGQRRWLQRLLESSVETKDFSRMEGMERTSARSALPLSPACAADTCQLSIPPTPLPHYLPYRVECSYAANATGGRQHQRSTSTTDVQLTSDPHDGYPVRDGPELPPGAGEGYPVVLEVGDSDDPLVLREFLRRGNDEISNRGMGIVWRRGAHLAVDLDVGMSQSIGDDNRLRHSYAESIVKVLERGREVHILRGASRVSSDTRWN